MTPFVDDEDRSALAIYSFLLDASVFIQSLTQARHESPTPADAFVAVLELKRLETIDTTDLPYHLLDWFPRQGYLWNIYRCVRALMYHAVVQLLDWASPAAADGGWLHVLKALQEFRTASLEIVQDMVQALLADLSVSLDGSRTEQDTCADRPQVQLNKLCWEDTLKHLWAVYHIAKHCGIESQQCEQANSLLAQMCRDLGMEELPQQDIDKGSPECDGVLWLLS